MKAFILSLAAIAALFVAGVRRQLATANAEGAAGTTKIFSRRADAAHSYTHLLIKEGSDNDHAAVCGAGNYPIGLTTDSPDAAEDLFNVLPLGAMEGTRKVRVATALGADIDLYTAASGFAQAEPGVAGTYYLVGRSVQAAQQVGAGDYLIEFAPRPPVKVKVVATPGSVGDIAAALNTPALVKFL